MYTGHVSRLRWIGFRLKLNLDAYQFKLEPAQLDLAHLKQGLFRAQLGLRNFLMKKRIHQSLEPGADPFSFDMGVTQESLKF